jgi:MFS family permease
MLSSIGPYMAALPAWLGVVVCGLVPALAALLVGRMITGVFTGRELSENAPATAAASDAASRCQFSFVNTGLFQVGKRCSSSLLVVLR